MENDKYYWVMQYGSNIWKIALYKNKLFRFTDGSQCINVFNIIESPIEMPQIEKIEL